MVSAGWIYMPVCGAYWMDGVNWMDLHTCAVWSLLYGWCLLDGHVQRGVYFMDGVYWMDLHACTVWCLLDGWSPLDGSTHLCGVYVYWMDGVHWMDPHACVVSTGWMERTGWIYTHVWSLLDGSTCVHWMDGVYWMDLHACVEST